MPEFSKASPTSAGPGLFSSAEVQRLMRIEFDRSQRYHYPLVCLLIAIDRLDRLMDLYGQELRRELEKGIQSLVRGAVRETDLISSPLSDQLLVLVPHTPPEGAGVLAQRLLDGARKLRFTLRGRPVRITLSIGGAHNQRHGNLFFDTLVEVAQGGLKVAQGGGGDRYVHSELYDFFQEKHAREYGGNPPTVAPLAPMGTELVLPPPEIEILRSIVAEEGGRALETARREQQAILASLQALQGDAGQVPLGGADIEHFRAQIGILERRITKLTQLLTMTEEELRRVVAMKAVDPGVASIYKSVQGLAGQEGQAELKKELMKRIFQANLDLKQQLTSGG